MNGITWIIIGIVTGLILTGILAIVLLRKRRQEKTKEINYRAFFILGISFLSLGIIYEIVFLAADRQVFLALGLPFIAIGLSYTAISLANRNK